jgi:hypothetical protein
MKAILDDNQTLPPDPVGDALADCYTFLLRRMREKSAAAAVAVLTPSNTHSDVADGAQADQPDGAAIIAVSD